MIKTMSDLSSFKRRLIFTVLGICLAAILPGSVLGENASGLYAENSTQFFVAPNAHADFVFSGGPAKSIPYRFLSEKGVVYATGHTEFQDGKHRLRLFVPPGYAEIETQDTSQRFGIVALPPLPKDRRDPFFCIDGAFSWLVPEDQRREDYVKIAARIGISVIRERLSWSAVNPKEGQFDWQTDRRYDKIRRLMKTNDIKVLEVSHDTPSWVGRGGLDGQSGKLPGDLIKTVQAWEQIARQWEPTWEALEIWNEPDISFSGNLPADQYVPLVRALTYRLRTSSIRVPLVGASMATFNRTWLETAIECGMLDGIDGFSFHTYAMTPAVENLYLGFSEMVHAKRPEMTFWLTECGRPWKRGVGRPARDQDVVSACDIIMKGVEAKASVVDYYYPFVYPYYDENENNFAMMDRWGSPLRSMGAYAQMIRLLSGADYLDAGIDSALETLHGPALKRHRLFKKGDELVLVLYTGDTTAATSIRFQPKGAGKPRILAESLTGEPVSIDQDGIMTFSDGLVYLRIKGGDPLQVGFETTGATTPPGQRRRWRQDMISKIEHKPVSLSPFAVVYRFDGDMVTPKSIGYHFKKTVKGPVPLLLRIYNFDDHPHRLSFKTLDTAGKLVLKEGEKRTIEIPGNAFVEQTVLADLSDELAGDFSAKLRFQYVPQGSSSKSGVCPVQLVFQGEADWDKTIAARPDHLRLPIERKESWRSNVGAQGKLTMEVAEAPKQLRSEPKSTWSMQVRFAPGDRWVYPVFSLPENVDLSQYRGMILRARCDPGDTTPRVMLYETKNGSGYMTRDAAFLPDGQWHTAVIPFDTLVHVDATPHDPNGRLDPDRVRTFSIGGNTKEEQLSIQVGDCLLYR